MVYTQRLFGSINWCNIPYQNGWIEGYYPSDLIFDNEIIEFFKNTLSEYNKLKKRKKKGDAAQLNKTLLINNHTNIKLPKELSLKFVAENIKIANG